MGSVLTWVERTVTRPLTVAEALGWLSIPVIPKWRVRLHKMLMAAKELVSGVMLALYSILTVGALFIGIGLHLRDSKIFILSVAGFVLFCLGTIAVGLAVGGLGAAFRTMRWETEIIDPSDLGGYKAPVDAIENARIIVKTCPSAHLEIDTFSIDPLLFVCEGKKRYCIAQWL